MSPLILPSCLILINFIILDNVTLRSIAYIEARCVPVIINRIIGELMDHMLGKSHQFYQDHLSGKLAKQITNLADGIEKCLSSIASRCLRGASLLLMTMITVYSVHPIFFYIISVWFILFFSLSLWMSKKLVSLVDRHATEESIVVGELVDSLSNHSNVRIFSRKSFEHARMTPFFNRQQQAYTVTRYYSIGMQSIQGSLIAIMIACTLYGLVYLYIQHLVTVGDFALILVLSLDTAYMMWHTTEVVDEFHKIMGRCKKSLEALMLPLDVQDLPKAQILQCPHGHITFHNVNFHYKGAEPFFQKQCLDLQAGKKVGLVGYSGGGKSTLVHLILRLYDITEGSICIDGQDLRHVTQDSLRAHIAMIPQDPALFHRSLMDNIRYGRIEATDAEVIEASKKAHAHEFIEKMPQGYDSLVGERGVKLSGGQRQRISIARAILKNSPILILDEATSQLDSMTESIIQESLWELMNSGFEHSEQSHKTVLVIAHRLSTLLHMDRILVMDQGVIVEDGTHAQLLRKKGLYHSLWNAQTGRVLAR